MTPRHIRTPGRIVKARRLRLALDLVSVLAVLIVLILTLGTWDSPP